MAYTLHNMANPEFTQCGDELDQVTCDVICHCHCPLKISSAIEHISCEIEIVSCRRDNLSTDNWEDIISYNNNSLDVCTFRLSHSMLIQTQ